jgi:hypothetical protein
MNASIDFLCTPQHPLDREIKYFFIFFYLTALVSLRLQEKTVLEKQNRNLKVHCGFVLSEYPACALL